MATRLYKSPSLPSLSSQMPPSVRPAVAPTDVVKQTAMGFNSIYNIVKQGGLNYHPIPNRQFIPSIFDASTNTVMEEESDIYSENAAKEEGGNSTSEDQKFQKYSQPD